MDDVFYSPRNGRVQVTKRELQELEAKVMVAFEEIEQLKKLINKKQTKQADKIAEEVDNEIK